jgi:hypothetical protein
MECSVSNGLLCEPSIEQNQTCPDFEISVLCHCEEEPTPALPNDLCQLDEPYRIQPNNCQEFLQCAPGLQGNQWATKTCGPDMMFNAKLQICDWPANVFVSRPECQNTEIIVTTMSSTRVTHTEVDSKGDCSK